MISKIGDEEGDFFMMPWCEEPEGGCSMGDRASDGSAFVDHGYLDWLGQGRRGDAR
jgi:hypothetical protein